MTEEKLLSIGTLSKLTGVNAITLRAWQRRYGLLKPKRTAKGHRLYTENDVTRIKEILFWLEKGIAISKVKPYLQYKKETEHAFDIPNYAEYEAKVVQAVSTFDQRMLETEMEEVISFYPLDVISQSIYPRVLQRLNDHWVTSDTAFSEQDFFEFYLRNKLASTFLQRKNTQRSQKLIVMCLENAFTEIEMLFMAAALSIYGFDIVLLSNHSVTQECEQVVRKTNASGVIIGISSVGKHINQVNRISQNLAIPVCVRTRVPTAAEPHLSSKIVLLPENYHLLLAKINEVYDAVVSVN
jgi:DNA-binding transcriptional MerR regulator